ncbi:LamG-like jellyroll fold domain-containing protein, partial [Candidatus Venteria ishoeyi]
MNILKFSVHKTVWLALLSLFLLMGLGLNAQAGAPTNCSARTDNDGWLNNAANNPGSTTAGNNSHAPASVCGCKGGTGWMTSQSNSYDTGGVITKDDGATRTIGNAEEYSVGFCIDGSDSTCSQGQPNNLVSGTTYYFKNTSGDNNYYHCTWDASGVWASPVTYSISPAPGNVSGELELWLKADAGTTPTTNNTAVTDWVSQSGTHTASGTAGPNYLDTDNGLNFRPALDFNGVNTSLNLGSDYIDVDSTKSGLTMIFAARTHSSIAGDNFIFDYGKHVGNSYSLRYTKSASYGVVFSTGLGGTHNSGSDAAILTYKLDFSGNGDVFVNGETLGSADVSGLTSITTAQINESAVHTTDAGPMSIGRQSKANVSTGRFYAGKLGEFLFYRQAMSTADINKAETTLAIKYGATLNKDYIFSDGSTVVWDATTNAGFLNGIAAIAHDDDADLMQSKSRSETVGAILTIAHGSLTTPTDVTADNLAFVWGHNGLDTDYSSTAVSGKLPMNRIWKVQDNDDKFAAMPYSIPDSTGAKYIITDSDTDCNFSTGTPVVEALSAGSNSDMVITKDHTDGQCFTFAKDIPEVAYPGNALDFDTNPRSTGALVYGGYYHVDTTHANMPGDDSPMTVEFWLNYKHGVTYSKYFQGSDDCLNMGYSASGAFWFGPGKGGGIPDGGLPTNRWFHFAATVDGSGNGQFYIDGEDAGTFIGDTSTCTNFSSLYIGSDWPNPETIPGAMDELRIWKVARTQAQIRAYMNGPIPNPDSEDDLSLYHKYDQGTANGDNTGITTIIDSSQYGHNGAATRFAFSGVDGNYDSNNFIKSEAQHSFQPGNGLNFDGTDDHVDIAANSALDVAAGSSTIELRFKADTFLKNGALLTNRCTGPNTRYSFHLSSDKLALWNGSKSGSISHAFDTNTWYHLALLPGATATEVLVDGVSIGSIDVAINTAQTGCPTNLGAAYNGGSNYVEFFDGDLDEVRIWNTVRTTDQIRAYMNRDIPNPTGETNLVAYYQFDYGQPDGTNTDMTEALDSSLNGHNGTLANFALTGSSSNYVDSSAYSIWTGTGGDSNWTNIANWTDTNASGVHLVPTTATNVHLADVGNIPSESLVPIINHLVIDSTGVGLELKVLGNVFAINAGQSAGTKPIVLMNGSQTHYVSGTFAKGLSQTDPYQPMKLAGNLSISGSGAYFTRVFPATVDANGYTFSYSGSDTDLIRGGTVSGDFGDEFPAINGPSRLVLNGTSSASLIGDRSIDKVALGSAGAMLSLGDHTLTATMISLDLNGSSGHVVATGTGELRQTYSSGSKTFPVGDGQKYTPIDIDITGGTGGSYVGVRVTTSKQPQNLSTTNFIERYWSVSTDITDFAADATATYVSNDVQGAEDKMLGLFYKANPWEVGNAAAGNSVSGSLSSAGDFTAGEDLRAILVSAIITGPGDSGSGDCSSGSTTCDIRTAINSVEDGGTITFPTNPTNITLTNGPLDLSKSLTIDGTGKKVTITAKTGERVFHVNGNKNTVTFKNLTIQGGSPTSASTEGPFGGGILVGTFTGNTATANVEGCTLTGNNANTGAAIYVQKDSSLNMSSSTVSGNTTTAGTGSVSGAGAEILNISYSTIAGNTTTGITSGVYAGDYDPTPMDSGDETGSRLVLINVLLAYNGGTDQCAVMGNSNLAYGPSNLILGTHTECGTPAVTTDPGLSALADNGGDTQTMAIYATSPAVDATTSCPPQDQRGVARSEGTCDIGAYEWTPSPEPDSHPTDFVATVDSDTQITTSWTDSTGTNLPSGYLVMCNDSGTFSDPVNGTAQSDDDCSDGSGVKNVTHGSGSYAWSGLSEGTAYYFEVYPYSNSGTLIDYKVDGTVPTATATTTTPSTTMVITDSGDSGNGDCSSGSDSCDIRTAIQNIADGGTITFANSPTNITLNGQLGLRYNLTIDGTGKKVTINGGDNGRVFDLDDRGADNTVTLRALNITGGDAGDENGGGILLQYGKIILDKSTVHGNSATNGGGIYVKNSSSNELTVTNSTIANNTATSSAGGIYVNADAQSVSITNSTIAANTSPNAGSGLFLGYGNNVSLINTLVADNINTNTTTNPGKADCFILVYSRRSIPTPSTVNDLTGSLIEDSDSCGTDVTSSDPGLLALTDNGGDTLTMAISAGSSAEGSADVEACLADDQRGVARPEGSACDIGAFELPLALAPTEL